MSAPGRRRSPATAPEPLDAFECDELAVNERRLVRIALPVNGGMELEHAVIVRVRPSLLDFPNTPDRFLPPFFESVPLCIVRWAFVFRDVLVPCRLCEELFVHRDRVDVQPWLYERLRLPVNTGRIAVERWELHLESVFDANVIVEARLCLLVCITAAL